MKMQSCGNCGGSIGINRKYCSKACLYASMRLPLRNCKSCSCSFSPEKSSQLFCSLKCYNRQSASERLGLEPPQVAGCRWIPLTQGLFCLVDDVNYENLSKYNWCAVNVKVKSDGRKLDRFYAKRVDYSSGKPKSTFMHRYILNAPDGLLIDHVNGNSLDNRAVNLRIATKAQNAMNSHCIGKIKFKGVSLTKSGKYSSKITANWSSKYLGLFNSPEEAARAYDEEARKIHGQFARLNFPNHGERPAYEDLV
jgi:HNH endonuclease/AP2 domain